MTFLNLLTRYRAMLSCVGDFRGFAVWLLHLVLVFFYAKGRRGQRTSERIQFMTNIKRTERGWAGHYICSHECLFRRNTLLECEDQKIVVSTVGNCMDIEASRAKGHVVTRSIGVEHYYETMAFHSDISDDEYQDADVTRRVEIHGKTHIMQPSADNEANAMHEAAVNEIMDRMESRSIL